MKKWQSHEEYYQVRAFMYTLFHNYYAERSCEKVISMVSDHIMGIGLGSEEIGTGRECFARFIQAQMRKVPSPIPYQVEDLKLICCGEHLWNCYALIELKIITGNWGVVRYAIRMVTTMQKMHDQWSFLAIHVSEAAQYTQNLNPVNWTGDQGGDNLLNKITPDHIHEIFNHMIPGGVISRSPEDGFPITIINTLYVQMLGYVSPQEYKEAHHFLFLKAVHPDDRDKISYAFSFILSTGKQYESEYRLRKKDGSYLWVHDVSCLTHSPQGNPRVISVIIDITDQIQRRHKLEMENGVDFLTKIPNRQGEDDYLKSLGNGYHSFLYAILDLDNFKKVNDLYGHLTGDEVLKHTAYLLSNTFDSQGLVCRLGGDEFALFIPDYEDLNSVKRQLVRISQGYHSYVDALCPDAGSSLSIGGVCGTEHVSPQERYRIADSNLYQVKRTAKGGILFTSLS